MYKNNQHQAVFISTKEAAELLSVHPNTIRNWTKIGLLKRYTSGRTVRYKRVDVLLLLKP